VRCYLPMDCFQTAFKFCEWTRVHPVFAGYSYHLLSKGWLRLCRPGCLVLCQGGLPVQRRSPIQALTGPSTDLEVWETITNYRNEWRRLTAKDADVEADRIAGEEHKWRLEKSVSHANTSRAHTCPGCGQLFCAAIALFSHKRSHRGSVSLPAT